MASERDLATAKAICKTEFFAETRRSPDHQASSYAVNSQGHHNIKLAAAGIV
jgi:hypothetical protein